MLKQNRRTTEAKLKEMIMQTTFISYKVQILGAVMMMIVRNQLDSKKKKRFFVISVSYLYRLRSNRGNQLKLSQELASISIFKFFFFVCFRSKKDDACKYL